MSKSGRRSHNFTTYGVSWWRKFLDRSKRGTVRNREIKQGLQDMEDDAQADLEEYEDVMHDLYGDYDEW